MDAIFKFLLAENGVLSLGWVLFLGACWLAWRLYADARSDRAAHRAESAAMTERMHEAILNNTQVMTALKVRLEERRGN